MRELDGFAKEKVGYLAVMLEGYTFRRRWEAEWGSTGYNGGAGLAWSWGRRGILTFPLVCSRMA